MSQHTLYVYTDDRVISASDCDVPPQGVACMLYVDVNVRAALVNSCAVSPQGVACIMYVGVLNGRAALVNNCAVSPQGVAHDRATPRTQPHVISIGSRVRSW